MTEPGCPSAPATTQPCTARGEKRRQALLAAAGQLFMEQGFDAVSLDDLVARVGGSKASIYRFFGNKQGLLIALIEYRCEHYFDLLQVPTTLGEQHIETVLQVLVERLYEIFAQPDHVALTRLIMQESQRDPELAERVYQAGFGRGIRMAARLLADAHAQGQIICPRPLESAIFFSGILKHPQWRQLHGLPQLEEGLQRHSFLTHQVQLFLAAHRNPS